MLRNIGFAAAMLAPFAAPAIADDAGRGAIVIVGNGSASSAPEYTSIAVTVTSLCYDTSRGAKDANAVLANRLVALLKNYAKDGKDKVVASGGPNERRTEVVYVGNQPKTLCEMKWRATNQLRLDMKNIEDLPDLQDQILGAVDLAAVDPDQVAQTYAELGQPSFHLYPETYTKLRTAAQGLAYDDAKLQYNAFASRCAFQDPRLTNITPPQYDVVAKANGQAIADGTSTPIMPDELEVTATWKFEWTFMPSASCFLPQ